MGKANYGAPLGGNSKAPTSSGGGGFLGNLTVNIPKPPPPPPPPPTVVTPGDNGMATLPGFHGITDDQGNALPQYVLNAHTLGADPYSDADLAALRERANERYGESAWINMARAQQELEEKAMLDKASQNAAAQGAEARASLAMRGGLRGGAAERLAGVSARDALLAQQGVRQQGAITRAGLGVEDERIRTDLLKLLPGMSLDVAQYKTGRDIFDQGQLTGAEQFNIGNLINNLAGMTQHGQFVYGEGMKQLGAQEVSDAIRAGGGYGEGGGAIHAGYKNVIKGNVSPLSTKGGALSNSDPIGKYFDKKNPLTKGGRYGR